MYVSAVQNQKLDLEDQYKKVERDLDDFMRGQSRETEQLKQLVVSQISKKADYQAIDHLKEIVTKKVDYDYFQTMSTKLKTEISQQIHQQTQDF
jgi:hypothetical protein